MTQRRIEQIEKMFKEIGLPPEERHRLLLLAERPAQDVQPALIEIAASSNTTSEQPDA